MPDRKPPRTLVRFDFKPGTSPADMHAAIEALREAHAPAPPAPAPVPPDPVTDGGSDDEA